MFWIPRLTCCTCTWPAVFVPGELSFATKDGMDVMPVGVNYEYTVCIQCEFLVHDGICYALPKLCPFPSNSCPLKGNFEDEWPTSSENEVVLVQHCMHTYMSDE
jgi:hypothetical protein